MLAAHRWLLCLPATLCLVLATPAVAPASAIGQPGEDEPRPVRLVLTDSIGQSGAAAFDAFEPDGFMTFADEDDQKRLLLMPGKYRLTPRGWPGMGVDIEVKPGKDLDVPMAMPQSVWLTFQLADPPKKDAPADPVAPKKTRVLLAMKSSAEMTTALCQALPTNDAGMRTIRAMRRAGLSPDQVTAALELCRKAVSEEKVIMDGTRTGDEWTQLSKASEAAHRVLATFGDESDVAMLEARLTQNKFPWGWDDAIATMALIEARLDLIEGGRTAALLKNEDYGASAAIALATLGYAPAEEVASGRLGGDTPQLWQLGALGGRLSERDLELLRSWVQATQQRKPELLATGSPWSYATPAIVCLLAHGTPDDWRLVAGIPLGMGVLERLGILAREVGPLAQGAAELGVTWPTYGLAASQRAGGGDSVALVALDTVQNIVGAVFAAAKEGTENAGNQNEYYWVALAASGWTPNAQALEVFTKQWIEPTGSSGIASQCEWNTHKPSWVRAANLVAIGDFSWDVMADYVTPAEFKAAVEVVAADKRPYRSDLLVAAHSVCSRANMPRGEFMPMGVDRRAYALRADEGAIVGVAELRPEWRDDTLRLGLRIRQRSNYLGGGLIDFHQGDITSYDHFGHATFPWMRFVSAVTLTRGTADVPLTRVGFSDDGWMIYEVKTVGRSLRDLWLTLTLKYADQTIPLTFDVARSDFARLVRRAESDIASARASLPSRPTGREIKSLAARLFAVGRCTEAWALLEPLAQRDTNAALLTATQFASLGDHTRAAAALGVVTTVDPRDADAWYDLAIEQYLDRKYDAAIASVDRVLTLDPSNESAPWLKARLLVILGRFDEAGELLRSPPLTTLDESEVRMLRYVCALRASDAAKDTGKARAKAAQEEMKAYAATFERNTPEARFWQDAHYAWGGGEGAKDCRTPAALCLYHTYRGLCFSVNNRADYALSSFKAAIETACVDTAEYRLAEAELARLKKGNP